MSTYAIGDVQGCYAELSELLALIKFNPSRDQLWFVGDLVNRGPQSLEVLRYVRSLGPAAITVLGNHDLHLLAVAFGGQDRLRADDTLDAILNARDRDELLDWLRHQPLLHHDTRIDYTMIHAGLPPQWDLRAAQDCGHEVEAALRNDHAVKELFAHMYGNKPNRWSDSLDGTDRLRFIVNCFTRMRVCDADGRLDLKFKGKLKNIPEGFFPWFRAPKRRSEKLRILCGHWSALDYYDGDGILALDTGCVWGGRLCAVRLDNNAEPLFVRSRQPRAIED
ncbi:MAG TPA: symmetrical bis(5'-nucleosyl)-tetraphosphatase [Steroidobacteraceae bacterium]|nr:symmetrical bis(5'-nucleosyl)-tetraphosphatase [Steroidobacteraceae bacterium]